MMEAVLEKAALLDKMEAEYKAFEELLAPLDGWQLTAPSATGEGSVKDVLAHLTAWHSHLLKVLRGAQQGREPAAPIGHLSDEEIERLNQRFYEAAKARPLNEVWAAFHATYVQVREAVAALGEEVIGDTRRFPWLHGLALAHYIAGDTFDHYQEHALWIRVWLGS
jgi:hypothetical protein